MPELPEIEVLRRDLEKEVVGRRFKDVEVRSGTNSMKVIRRHGRRKEFQDLLEGAKVEKVERIGRSLIMELDNQHSLVVDLGNSGNLVKTSASEEMVTHTHIVISFTIGGQLRVVDPKPSSEVSVLPKTEIEEIRENPRVVLLTPVASRIQSAVSRPAAASPAFKPAKASRS